MMNTPFLVALVVVQLPLMLVLPIVVGWWVRRRYGIGWRVYLAGGLTFVASQVVHLPLNYALGLLGGEWGAGVLPLPLMALAAGLTAAVCEQSARWVALRFALRRVRGWSQALQFGAGHGGIEAIILGLLALSTTAWMIVMQLSGVQSQGLSGDAAAQAKEALQAFWGAAWYTPLLAGLERAFTITFHIAVSVLVMRAVMRRQAGYLLAAVVAHTAYDAWAVWGNRSLGLLWTELGLGLIAAAALWLIVRLRETPAGQPAIADG
jgi:uncharacterized membrane protein YhfC